MRPGLDDTFTRGPQWDPAGTVPFRTYVQEVHAWLNATSGRATPRQQAAALQRGPQGLARIIAMRNPPHNINYGVQINGVTSDPVTYLTFSFSDKFDHFEDERELERGSSSLQHSRMSA